MTSQLRGCREIDISALETKWPLQPVTHGQFKCSQVEWKLKGSFAMTGRWLNNHLFYHGNEFGGVLIYVVNAISV